MLPQGFFRKDIVNTRRPEELVVIQKIKIVIEAPVFVVVERDKTGERHKLFCMDIESRRGNGPFVLRVPSWELLLMCCAFQSRVHPRATRAKGTVSRNTTVTRRSVTYIILKFLMFVIRWWDHKRSVMVSCAGLAIPGGWRHGPTSPEKEP